MRIESIQGWQKEAVHADTFGCPASFLFGVKTLDLIIFLATPLSRFGGPDWPPNRNALVDDCAFHMDE